MNVTYLCLGGNIGDREKALSHAILKINEQVGNIVAKSTIYETESWGVEKQQAYFNLGNLLSQKKDYQKSINYFGNFFIATNFVCTNVIYHWYDWN